LKDVKAEFSASLLQSSVSHILPKSFEYAELLLKEHVLFFINCAA